MSKILEPAKLFFDACETGKGWAVCKEYCLPNATFSSQTGVLAEINTLEDYCEWVKDLFTPVPDGRYELFFLQLMNLVKLLRGMVYFTGRKLVQAVRWHPLENLLLLTMFMRWYSKAIVFST